MRYKPTSIFNRISSENGDIVGFPEEFDDLSLSPELRAEIFQKFKFKTLTAKSSAAAIIRNIYDAEFGTIYHSEKVTKTQTKTTLNPRMNHYFRFVYENIRPDFEKANMCRCKESKLNDFCGHLLCGTCEKWADARDSDGKEELAPFVDRNLVARQQLAAKNELVSVERQKCCVQLRALKESDPAGYQCLRESPSMQLEHPLFIEHAKSIQRINSS
jgi:hypothetical protein